MVLPSYRRTEFHLHKGTISSICIKKNKKKKNTKGFSLWNFANLPSWFCRSMARISLAYSLFPSNGILAWNMKTATITLYTPDIHDHACSTNFPFPLGKEEVAACICWANLGFMHQVPIITGWTWGSIKIQSLPDTALCCTWPVLGIEPQTFWVQCSIYLATCSDVRLASRWRHTINHTIVCGASCWRYWNYPPKEPSMLTTWPPRLGNITCTQTMFQQTNA